MSPVILFFFDNSISLKDEIVNDKEEYDQFILSRENDILFYIVQTRETL